MGDNFTAREMAELDNNLYIRPVSMEILDVPAPLDIPEPGSIRENSRTSPRKYFRGTGKK